jgi:hypothetical protein
MKKSLSLLFLCSSLLVHSQWIKEKGTGYANNIESFAIGGELAWNIGKQWGVGFGTATPLFGKVIYKATSFSGGVFVSF